MSGPVPQSISPSSIPKDSQPHSATIVGDRMAATDDVYVGPDISVKILNVTHAEVDVEIVVPDHVNVGFRHVTCSDPDGVGSIPNGLEIIAP